MLEQRGDLWVLAHQLKCDAVCITTNGFLKKDGSAVMGRGYAREAMLRWPDLPELIGSRLKISFHIELFSKHLFKDIFYDLIAFPTKPKQFIVNDLQSNIVKRQRVNFGPGCVTPGWAAMADPKLIEKSSYELMELINRNNWQKVLLPSPEVKSNKILWEDKLKPIIMKILDDRVIVTSK